MYFIFELSEYSLSSSGQPSDLHLEGFVLKNHIKKIAFVFLI